MRRAFVVAAAALLSVGGAAAPSAALTSQVIPGCEPADGYEPGELCQVLVAPLEPECVNTVPRLPYAVAIEAPENGSPATTIDITWVNPDGDDVVLEDQSLTGTLVWPGTVVGSDGTATDWPDWTQRSDGTWTRGDSFTWATGSVDIVFGSNPSATLSVDYPDSADCRPEGAVLAQTPVTPARTPVTPARTSGLSGVLAATGVEAESLAIGAGALVAAGAGLVLLRRARRDGV